MHAGCRSEGIPVGGTITCKDTSWPQIISYIMHLPGEKIGWVLQVGRLTGGGKPPFMEYPHSPQTVRMHVLQAAEVPLQETSKQVQMCWAVAGLGEGQGGWDFPPRSPGS
jgi:hypothetical protein